MTDEKIIELKKALYKPALYATTKCRQHGIYCMMLNDFTSEAITYIFLNNSKKYLDNEENFYYIVRQGYQCITHTLIHYGLWQREEVLLDRNDRRIKKYQQEYKDSIEKIKKLLSVFEDEKEKLYSKKETREEKLLMAEAYKNFKENKCQILNHSIQ